VVDASPYVLERRGQSLEEVFRELTLGREAA